MLYYHATQFAIFLFTSLQNLSLRFTKKSSTSDSDLRPLLGLHVWTYWDFRTPNSTKLPPNSRS